jgi:hypothetical protein
MLTLRTRIPDLHISNHGRGTVYSLFPQALNLSRTGYDCFLPEPLRFINHKPWQHPTPGSPETVDVVTITKWLILIVPKEGFEGLLCTKRSRDSVVGTATGYGLDDRGVGVRVPVRSRIFSPSFVQTGSRAVLQKHEIV